MDTKDLISICIFAVFLLLIKCMLSNKKDGFSLSRKPMETDWSLLHRNPFDDMDYQTPIYYNVYKK